MYNTSVVYKIPLSSFKRKETKQKKKRSPDVGLSRESCWFYSRRVKKLLEDEREKKKRMRKMKKTQFKEGPIRTSRTVLSSKKKEDPFFLQLGLGIYQQKIRCLRFQVIQNKKGSSFFKSNVLSTRKKFKFKMYKATLLRGWPRPRDIGVAYGPSEVSLSLRFLRPKESDHECGKISGKLREIIWNNTIFGAIYRSERKLLHDAW